LETVFLFVWFAFWLSSCGGVDDVVRVQYASVLPKLQAEQQHGTQLQQRLKDTEASCAATAEKLLQEKQTRERAQRDLAATRRALQQAQENSKTGPSKPPPAASNGAFTRVTVFMMALAVLMSICLFVVFVTAEPGCFCWDPVLVERATASFQESQHRVT